jgi:Ca2+:H+ antiporter
MTGILKSERFLFLGAIIAGAAFLCEHLILESGQVVSLIAGLLLICIIIVVSLRVAHHAEVLAEKVGEPYGTMILTLSAVLVEVIILIMMLSHTSSPTLARDTIYSAVMIDMNGILGLAAILGGLRHGEQPYNVDSGNTYIVMILTGMGISMVVPEFIPQHHWQVFSVFTICSMLLLYGVFLRL